MKKLLHWLIILAVALAIFHFLKPGEKEYGAPVFGTVTAENPVVQTKYGTVRGENRDGVAIFRGIPYGGPCDGENRFKAPLPPEPWEGVRECTVNGPVAVQFGSGSISGNPSRLGEYFNGGHPEYFGTADEKQSENCLVLDVLTPGIDKKGRPVLVYIHGGGFSSGSGTLVLGADTFVREEDIVVVGVNHRLNVFGYLYLGAFDPEYASSGMAGILDLVQALRWVRDNIAGFGGDPSKVTIMGESGGGKKVSTLLAMKEAKGLFSKAIVESGSAPVGKLSREEAAKRTLSVLDNLGISHDEWRKILSVPAEQLLSASSMTGLEPVADGINLEYQEATGIQAFEVSKDIPLMVGSSTDEMGVFMPYGKLGITWDNIKERLLGEGRSLEYGGIINEEKADRIIETFKAENIKGDDAEHTFLKIISLSGVLGGGAFHHAMAKAGQGGAPVFNYVVEYDSKAVSDTTLRCAWHTADLPLQLRIVLDAESEDLSKQMAHAWAAFIRTGNPSTKDLKWPAFTSEGRLVMDFDDVTSVKTDPLKNLREALENRGGINPARVVTNPIDVDYAFTREHQEGGREAADPVVVLFNDRYYLFPSKSYGYWSSDDMQHWTFITNSLMPFQNYAPTVMAYRGELYWAVSFHNKIYKTSTPEDGASWVVASDSMMPYIDEPGRWVVDPYLFVDDDERVFLYWGCTQVDPIMGVELDPENGFRAKTAPVELIPHNEKVYGWECRGDKNETEDPSSNEGSAMLKHDGRYYLQYAGPGTEYDSYGDGLYVGDSPLGPFEHYAGSPFSVKPGGWMTGAGHGDTFQDRYGNWWHVSSTVISQRFLFERRIGFYPVVFTKDGGMQALTDFSDYPYELPDHKVDWTKESPWTGWMDLSIGKNATASSEKNGHPATCAADNSIKTWWSAQTGQEGEWLEIDLGHLCDVHAIQVNFADEDFGMYEEGREKSPYRYRLEGSPDGTTFHVLCDRSDNSTTRPHELIVLPEAAKVRQVRLMNTASLSGKLSLFDLRIFGLAKGKKPAAVSDVKVRRSFDQRRFDISWPAAEGARGYVVHWGVSPDELYSACQTLEPHLELGLFSADQEYFFRVDAFNDSGVTKGK